MELFCIVLFLLLFLPVFIDAFRFFLSIQRVKYAVNKETDQAVAIKILDKVSQVIIFEGKLSHCSLRLFC